MRLLLAEDEKSLSKAINAILEKNNFSVDVVYDGKEALEFLKCENYDGVIFRHYDAKNRRHFRFKGDA